MTLSRDKIQPSEVFSLFPNLDRRLIIKEPDLTIPAGAEGLVIRDDLNRIYYKVKKKDTIDLKVIGIQEGGGKYKGKLGALITSMGKVGTGLTDKDRDLPIESWINKTIEIEFMEITNNKKLRQPRLLRVRIDK